MKSRRLKSILVVFALLSVVFTYAISTLWKEQKSRAESLFREYIQNPIPESVKNIKADKNEFGGPDFSCVIKFDIDREDFNNIANSRPFIQISNLEYNFPGKGHLHWSWDSEHYDDMFVYDIKEFHFEPSWFDLESILSKNPEAYGYENYGDKINIQAYESERITGVYSVETCILIYNKEENEAFFFIQHWPK